MAVDENWHQIDWAWQEYKVYAKEENMTMADKKCQELGSSLLSVKNAPTVVKQIAKFDFKLCTLIRCDGLKINSQWQDLAGNLIDVSDLFIKNDQNGGTLSLHPRSQSYVEIYLLAVISVHLHGAQAPLSSYPPKANFQVHFQFLQNANF